MNAEPIFQTLLGYRAAATLRAAIELDYFSAISLGKRTPEAIAALKGGTSRSARILLDALAALCPKLLRKSGKAYALTPVSKRFLVQASPDFVGPLMPLYGHRMMWEAFYDLPQAVRAGMSVKDQNAHTPHQRFWEDFARATAREAVPRAQSMLRVLGRIPKACEILDLACGSGSYGATFAKAIPGAKLTLFDQAHVLATTKTLVDVPARYLEGDLFVTPFGGPYDLILASHVFHHFDERECRTLARKVAGALRPGGRLLIQEFIPDEARAKKPQALLFAVTMLVWTRSGDAYTLRQIRSWLEEAGLRKIACRPSLPPADLVLAERPLTSKS